MISNYKTQAFFCLTGLRQAIDQELLRSGKHAALTKDENDLCSLLIESDFAFVGKVLEQAGHVA